MSRSTASKLRALERLKERFGDGGDQQKRRLLSGITAGRLANPSQVRRFHELLCFMRAYPDGPELLELVEQVLATFGSRKDVRRSARELVNSGIAGTRIENAFFWETANWLERRWPDALKICWDSRFEQVDKLHGCLQLLLPYAETTFLDETPYEPRRWLRTLKGGAATDATFLVRRFRSLRVREDIRRRAFEDLEIPMAIEPGPDTPSRSVAKYRGSPIVWQSRPRRHSRPSLGRAVREPPLSVAHVPRRQAAQLVDLARAAMLTRNRDLEAIAYANPDDVWLVECGDGLQFAWMGALPAHRHILETVYVFLTLKNGVPVGYVQAAALLGSAEVNFNVFESFRGADSAHVYGRALSAVHHLMNSDCFVIDPYQLGGDGNTEALKSGAWWFYYKLGYRPRDRYAIGLARQEARRVARDRNYRTPPVTLRELGEYEMYFYLGTRRDDVLSIFPLHRVARRVSAMLAQRFGADRDRGVVTCVSEASALLGAAPAARLQRDERRAWEMWAPYALVLPGVHDWNGRDRKALAAVISAKGGRCELDYLRRFDAHPRLRQALEELARDPVPD